MRGLPYTRGADTLMDDNDDVARNEQEVRVPGEEGLWILIFGDMIIFAAMFANYLYYRGKQSKLFSESQDRLHTDLGVLNTLLLLTSSMLVACGMRAIRRDQHKLATSLFAGTFLCGLGFIIDKGIEYSSMFHQDITASTNDFFTYYFVLTGFHLLHVTVGMEGLIFMIVRTRHGRQEGHLIAIEGCASFWHMVDLLWIVLFPLLYLIR